MSQPPRSNLSDLCEIAAIHKLVTENSRDIIIIADFNGNRSFVSAAGFKWGGWSKEEILKRKSLDLVHPEDLPRIAPVVQQLRDGGDSALIECRVQLRNGGYTWVEASLKTIRDPVTDQPVGILNIVRDISRRKLAELAREFQHSLIEAIHAVSLDGIVVVDEHHKIVSCNRRLGEIWGIPVPAEILGVATESNRIPEHDFIPQVLARIRNPDEYLERVNRLHQNPELDDKCQIAFKDGRTVEHYTTPLHSGTGKYLGRVWFFRDISLHKKNEQRFEEAYRAVETLAITDSLTGLANRRHFDHFLATEWRRELREGDPLSLLLIDVDYFKNYNDHYGHLNGDTCLKQIAEVFRYSATRSADLVARFGGEEFAVVLPATPSEGAIEVANSICENLRGRAIPHEGSPFARVTVSIGCASAVAEASTNPSWLIEQADQALYKAKRLGRNQVHSIQLSGESSEKQKPIPIRPPSLIASR